MEAAWRPARLSTSISLESPNRCPIVGWQNNISAPSNVFERAAHFLEVIIDAGRDTPVDVEVNLTRDVTNDCRYAVFGLNVNALVAGRIGNGGSSSRGPI